MKRYRAAVVGLGSIGLEFDFDAEGDDRVQTHCRAFATHPGFDLVGGADPSALARDRLVARYGVPAFPTLSAMLQSVRPEVIAIAADTATHRSLVEEALAAHPRAILCEKPLAVDARAGAAMVAAAERAGVLLVVNYNRRFDPAVAELRDRIRYGEFGEIYKGVAWYAKGVANNGSHYLDLLDHLLGEGTGARLLSPGRRLADGDTEPDFIVHFGASEVFFLAGRHEHYSHGGFDLLGSLGRIQFDGGGRRVCTWRATPDRDFPRYSTLQETANQPQLDMRRYQWHVVEAIHRALQSGHPPASTGTTALRTLRIIEGLNKELECP